MSKKPKIDHDYHAGKDKLKNNDSRIFPEEQKTRDAIMRMVMAEVERSPDRLITQAKKKSKKGLGKKLRGQQKEAKLIEVGD